MGWEVTCLQKDAAEVKSKLTSERDGLSLFEVPVEVDSQLDREDSDAPSSSESSSKPGTPPPKLPTPRGEPEKPDEPMPPPGEDDNF